MAKYMVIETIREGALDDVYRRFYKYGRLMPQGMYYIDSWLEKSGKRCFQLMEAGDIDLFDEWMKNWEDLCEFEIAELGEKPVADEYRQ